MAHAFFTGADVGHVASHGAHQIQRTNFKCRTPEVADDTQILTLYETFCATAGCGCNLPKLADAIRELDENRALAGSEAPASLFEYEPSDMEDENDGEE